jgi:hypothetical protein
MAILRLTLTVSVRRRMMKLNRLLAIFFGRVVFGMMRKYFDSAIATSEAAYYYDIVVTRANFHTL